MKNVILSFDYELFFGDKSGTILNSLITPTNQIMDAMESVGLRGTFFVDTLMFKYLKLNEDKRSEDDLQLLEDQLRDIVRRGHRIELHLHPHWVDAKYNGDGTWDFSEYRHYMLSSFSEDEIINMFNEGVEYLTSIGSEIEPGYNVCAFRAGGWAIQPFDLLKKAFLTNGIIIDSSAAPGFYNVLPNSLYDFRKMPHKPIYRFTDDVCKEDPKGIFIEVPITTYRMSLVNYIRYKFVQKKYEGYTKRLTDGSHERITEVCSLNKVFFAKFIDRFRLYRMLTFSQEYPIITLYLIKHTPQNIYCFIDHPKDFSRFTSIAIKKIGSRYKGITYFDLAKMIVECH